jgi:hypothetical protein
MGLGEKEGTPAGARVDPDALRRAASEADAAYTWALHAELDRRLDEISRCDDRVFGRMGRIDVVVSTTLFVVLPIVAVLAAWHFR